MAMILDLAHNPPQPRTAYVIKLTQLSKANAWDIYAGYNRSWADVVHARRFEFMTTATAAAIMDLGLACDQFTIEAI